MKTPGARRPERQGLVSMPIIYTTRGRGTCFVEWKKRSREWAAMSVSHDAVDRQRERREGEREKKQRKKKKKETYGVHTLSVLMYVGFL